MGARQCGAGAGGAHVPLGVHGLLCAQQRPGQDGEEPQAHLGVSVRLQAAPEDGDQGGQRFSEGRAWNRAAGSCPRGGGSLHQTGSSPCARATPPLMDVIIKEKSPRTFSPLHLITQSVNFHLCFPKLLKIKPKLVWLGG